MSWVRPDWEILPRPTTHTSEHLTLPCCYGGSQSEAQWKVYCTLCFLNLLYEYKISRGFYNCEKPVFRYLVFVTYLRSMGIQQSLDSNYHCGVFNSRRVDVVACIKESPPLSKHAIIKIQWNPIWGPS